MLETRMAILAPVVNYFVVCEAAETHSGKPKPYYFLENIERFHEWEHMTIYVRVPDLTGPGRNSWEREHYHRSCIADGLKDAAPDDWVIVGDCDEIPSPEAVSELTRCYWLNRVKLELTMFYYDLNHRVDQGWSVGAYRHAVESDPNRIRTCADGLAVPLLPPGKVNAGWHFSYFNGPQAIVEKIEAFMHHADIAKDVPRDVNWIKQRVDAGADLYDRDITIEHIPLTETLPQYILEHTDHYRRLGWIVE